MKETRTCPKCNSQDIIHVPVTATRYNYITFSWLSFSPVPVTRYVCGQCGFSEEWIDSQEDLAKLKQKYG